MRRTTFGKTILSKIIVGATIFCCSGALPIRAQQIANKAVNQKVEIKQASADKARELVGAALAAMGGAEKLRRLSSLTIEGVGHVFALEQSERPAGPWLVNYEQSREIRDLNNQRLRKTVEIKQAQLPDWTASTLIVANGAATIERAGKQMPGSVVQVQAAEQAFALAPERILLTALDAADLRAGADTRLQDVPHQTVEFTWQNIPVTLYLNRDTALPTAIETVSASPYEHFWSVWGDFTTRTYLSFWTLESGGLRLPRQLDVERNDQPYRSFTATKLTVNAPLDDAAFVVSDEVRKAFAARPAVKIDDLPLGVPDRPAVELASGIVKIPGRWDVCLVRQPDGVIVIEAPISSGYSAKVLAEAARRFPDLPVKAVITTSDAFPHLGGVREYAARSIPIFALDLNKPILERVLRAKHGFYPDALELKPRAANFKIVSQKTIVGAGANRLEVYPIRTETGERMLMVYFPEHRLLYAGDLVQKLPDGSFFMPQYLSEVEQAVEREKLRVDSIFAMHSDKLARSEIVAAIAAATNESSNANAQPVQSSSNH